MKRNSRKGMMYIFMKELKGFLLGLVIGIAILAALQFFNIIPCISELAGGGETSQQGQQLGGLLLAFASTYGKR